MTACAEYSDNTEACGVDATWTSAAPTVATVDAAGVVTGVAPGTARISAVYERQTAHATVTVGSVSLTSLSFSAGLTDHSELMVGRSAQFSVWARYSDDTRSDVTADAEVTSSNARVATVERRGEKWRVDAVAAGTATISASYEGERVQHDLRITEPLRPWTRSGTGANILDLPTRITRIRIEGEYNGRGENFVVWCGSAGDRGGLLVNEIIGTGSSTRYSGVHSARRSYGGRGDPCRELQIEHSNGVRWTITETSPRSGLSPSASTGSASGDEAAVRRARERRIQY